MPTASKYSSPTPVIAVQIPPNKPANGEGHRNVHGQVPRAQVAHGALEERRAAVEHDGGCRETSPPSAGYMQLRAQVDVEFRPGGHGCHHCLEPQQAGDAELAQSQAVFAGQLLGGAVGLIRMGGIADMAQLTEHLAQRQLPVGPAHLQAMVGQVQTAPRPRRAGCAGVSRSASHRRRS